MRIAGLEKNSFVDYPGRVAAVLFTPGCNMDCFYCHNRNLINPHESDVSYDEAEVLEFLNSRRFLLDGVVITGGEPTLQSDLIEFIDKVKAMDYHIKLDTNGLRPWVVKELLDRGTIDFIAMDIKAPLDKYFQIVNRDVDESLLRESISLIMNSGIDYEFRTTVAPTLSIGDIMTMATTIAGAKSYILQQYRRPGKGTDMFGLVDYPEPRAAEFLLQAAELASKLVQHCDIRGLDIPEVLKPNKTEKKVTN